MKHELTEIARRDEYEEFPDSDSHANLGRPFRVKARIYNNRLIRAREELGLSVTQAAERFGMSLHTIYNYENLKNSPWSLKDYDWLPSAKKLAEAYGYHPEELWPDVIRDVERRYIETEVSTAAPALAQAPEELVDQAELRTTVRKALASLSSPRQEQIIRRLYGIDCEPESVASVADRFSVCTARIGELKKKALGHLQHKSRTKDLELFYPEAVAARTGIDPFERAKIVPAKIVPAEVGRPFKQPKQPKHMSSTLANFGANPNFQDGDVAVWCAHLNKTTFWAANWVRLTLGAYFTRGGSETVDVQWYIDCDKCAERRMADGKHQPTMKGGAALHRGKGVTKV